MPDIHRGRVLSIKFMLNLFVSFTVLPICSFILQNGYEIRSLFFVMILTAALVFFAALILPNPKEEDRLDNGVLC